MTILKNREAAEVSMKKVEFPKIKKARAALPDASPINTADQADPGAPASRRKLFKKIPKLILVSAFFVMLQFVLLLKTYEIFREIKAYHMPQKPAGQAAPNAKNSRELINNLEEVNLGKNPKIAKKPPQILSDFNRPQLLTNLNTRIHPSKLEGSAPVLTLAIDTENRFGPSGGALSVGFDFSKAAVESASFDIDLPVMDLAHFKKLTFRLLVPQAGAPSQHQIKIHLVPTAGERLEYEFSEFFSFWKRYEIDLWKGRAAPAEFLIKQVRVFLIPGRGAQKGVWYLDDIVLE